MSTTAFSITVKEVVTVDANRLIKKIITIYTGI